MKWSKKLFVVFLLIASLSVSFVNFPNSEDVYSDTCSRVEGIDVHNYVANFPDQPNYVNWDTVVSHNPYLKFVFVKATQTTKDEEFDANVTGAHNHNLLVGAYHFGTPNLTKPSNGKEISEDDYKNEAIAEANLFFNTIKPHILDGTLTLVPALDIENGDYIKGGIVGVPPSSLAIWINTWMYQVIKNFMEIHLAVNPILYCDAVYYENTLKKELENTGESYPLWVARYNGIDPCTGSPFSSTDLHWDFWQYSETGHIDGIYNPGLNGVNLGVDLDVFNGDLATLQSNFVIKQATPSVPLDIVFAIDRTGSMSDEISVIKSKAVEIINAIQSKNPDTYFGLVSFMDYPGYYAYPGYSAQYGDASYGDVPYKVDVPLTSNISSVTTAINGLTLGWGGDDPQDYTRVLYESMYLNWRPSAKKILIIFGDAPTHDLNFAGYNFGGDPGRDGIAQTSDDLDFETVVNQVKEKGIMVFAVDSGGTPESAATFRGMSTGYATAVGTNGQYFKLKDADSIPGAISVMMEGFQYTSYYELLGWTTITNYNSTIASGETVTAGTINVVQKGIDWLLKVLLHWPGSDLDLILIDPNGNQVVPGGNVTYSGSDALPEYYEIRNPMPGTWTIKVYGKDVSDSKEYYGVEVFERAIGATITATAGSGGTINPSGTVSVNYGGSQSFTIKADAGYFIYKILVDNTPIQFNNPMVYTYTFNNVTANHTIQAEFMKIPDTTPPTVTLPTINGVNLDVPGAVITTNSGTFSFTVSAYDESGIGRMVVKVNGVVQIDKNNLDPTIYLSEGVNTVEVTVYDTAGNYTTKSFKVISDTKPPVIDVTLPETVSSQELTVKGTVVDLVTGVQSVTVNDNPVILTLEGNFETKLALSPGANTVIIEATDNVGNKSTKSFTVSYIQPQAKQSYIVILKVGDPNITVNGISQKIDAQGSKPIIKNGRTLLPIRTLIESLGGQVLWDAKEQKVTITLNGHSIVLWIGKTTALVDGSKTTLDVAPTIITGRTYLPLRFISENLGASVNWDDKTQTVTIYYWP
jgi:GH25 family lysozyme M1 (1,4-beta-N-acetylmuramidase)